MNRRYLVLPLLLAALLLLAGCSILTEAAGLDTTETQSAVADKKTDAAVGDSIAEFTPTAALSVSGEFDGALMSVDDDGNFNPNEEITRCELCEVLAAVIDGLPEGDEFYPDLPAGEDGSEQAAALAAAELLPWQLKTDLEPDANVTADEIHLILSRAAQCMSAEESTRFTALADEFSGASLITRAQLAYIAVTAAGREPVEGALLVGGCVPQDVQPGDAWWAYIAEAVTETEPEIPEEGVYRVNGWLYGVWRGGELIKDLDYGVWTFDINGRYTTGDETLDAYLADALEESGAAETDDIEEALQKAYLYVKYNFDYVVTPADMETVDTGVTGWEYERALRFFQYGGGTCYGYAATFGLMARILGQNAYIVSAQINQYDWPHGFVVIPEDGIDWIYDPELESTRQDRHEDLELFHIQNYTIYNYWYESDW